MPQRILIEKKEGMTERNMERGSQREREGEQRVTTSLAARNGVTCHGAYQLCIVVVMYGSIDGFCDYIQFHADARYIVDSPRWTW